MVGCKRRLDSLSRVSDELETADGMAVHAYLHRKEGQASNAEYWYQRAGRKFHRPTLAAEWQALVEALLPGGV